MDTFSEKFEKYKFSVCSLYEGLDVSNEKDQDSGKNIIVLFLFNTMVAIIRGPDTDSKIISFRNDCPPDIAVQIFFNSNKFWNLAIGSPFVDHPTGVKFVALNNRVYPIEKFQKKPERPLNTH